MTTRHPLCSAVCVLGATHTSQNAAEAGDAIPAARRVAGGLTRGIGYAVHAGVVSHFPEVHRVGRDDPRFAKAISFVVASPGVWDFVEKSALVSLPLVVNSHRELMLLVAHCR